MPFFFFFNDTATTEIYTLSLHDALPISPARGGGPDPDGRHPGHPELHGARAGGGPGQGDRPCRGCVCPGRHPLRDAHGDRKSTRLNSSHLVISYAVFCLKKKIKTHSNALRYARVLALLPPQPRQILLSCPQLPPSYSA